MTNTKTQLKNYNNEKVSVSFFEKEKPERSYIVARDKADIYNQPTVYTRNIRGIDKAWDYIKENFNDETSFNDIWDTLTNFNLKAHHYCAMD